MARCRTYMQALSEGMLSTGFAALYDGLLTTSVLPEYFENHGPFEPDGDDAMTRNPLTWRYGCEGEMTTFKLLERSPEQPKNFHILSGMVEAFRPWSGFHDYSKLAQNVGERPGPVDSGCDNGTLTEKILKTHPDVRPEHCILQERQAVVDLAKQRKVKSGLPSSVECQVRDFFTPQPIRVAKTYHFRAILHDRSGVVGILSNALPAVAPDSNIVTAQCVILEQDVEGLTWMMDLMTLNRTVVASEGREWTLTMCWEGLD